MYELISGTVNTKADTSHLLDWILKLAHQLQAADNSFSLSACKGANILVLRSFYFQTWILGEKKSDSHKLFLTSSVEG